MFRRWLLIGGVLLVLALLALPQVPPALAAGCPQTVTINDTAAASGLGDAAGVELEIAQSFISPCTGTFAAFKVRFSASVNSPSGDATWYLKGDEFGLPGATITSGTLTPVAATVVTATPTSGVTLNEGGMYWLQLTVPNQTTDNRYQWSRGSASTYANGACYQATKGAGNWAVLAGDCYFIITIGPIVATNTPASTSTPSDTATPTITPSPTPNYAIEVTATSGAPMKLERTATYGDLTTFGGQLIVGGMLFFLFVYTYWRDRARAGIDS